MKNVTGLLIQVVSNIILAVGCLYGYWSFSVALLIYISEIIIYSVIGSIYFLFSNENVNPGGFIGGGFFIVAISFLLTLYISSTIGEFRANSITSEYDMADFLKTQLKNSWYLILIAFIAAMISFFKEQRKHRAGFLGQLLMQRVLTTFAILGLCALLVSLFNEKHKIWLLMIVITCRILVEFWVYKPELSLLKKTDSGA